MTDVQERLHLTGPDAADFLSVGPTTSSFNDNTEMAKEQYRQFCAIHFASLLDPVLLTTTLRLCESTQWANMSASCGFRQKEEPQRAGRVLNLALNRPAFLRWLEAVTECGPLSRIEGGVAQTLHRPGDELMWHDDYPDLGRRLAIVLNLSTQPYGGGEFEMRRKHGETLLSHRYTDLNSALIFSVDHALEHRVRPLSSGGPRRVFAGWAFALGAA